VTVVVYAPVVSPGATVKEDGDVAVEKSTTCSVTVVLWFKLPLVPLIVSVELAVGVDADVFTVMVVEPEPVTVVGLKLAFAPVGNPVVVNDTTPVNPPDGVIVTVYVVEDPRLTVCEDGVAAIVKLPAAFSLGTTVKTITRAQRTRFHSRRPIREPIAIPPKGTLCP
jgi:hypothetical protein